VAVFVAPLSTTGSRPGDTGPADAGAAGAGPENAGPDDAGPEDAGPEDAGPDGVAEGAGDGTSLGPGTGAALAATASADGSAPRTVGTKADDAMSRLIKMTARSRAVMIRVRRDGLAAGVSITLIPPSRGPATQ